MFRFLDLWDHIKCFYMGTSTARQPQVLLELERARQEWQTALQVFNEISDPELIDYAVFNLKAAEKKYGYYLKNARRGQAGSTYHSA